ncbi:MBL fold metallo-hydrolase [Paenibacillus paeoniae]|uniref:MBL fold metallo-hydrolase n=1 Tax=Paenibacillus paeoniae TaxID=2292705 RepID=UPI001F0CBB88|nr:MBL fold metallo-hydrolase [Paenibacillus paeoniae]
MRNKRFANEDQVEQHNSFKQFKRWRQERIRKLKLKDYSYRVPQAEPDLPFLKDNRDTPSITWIGHSTFLIQLGGLNIVTDPVWSGQMAFQKRLAPPGIPIEDVPPVDVVLVSHSHYDHLSIASLRRLTGGKQLLVPAGLSAKLRLKGFTSVRELHWWESVTVKGVTFTFVPSQHWTRRNPWDTNSSHWGGWVMETSGTHRTAKKDREKRASNEQVAASHEETAAASAWKAGDPGITSNSNSPAARPAAPVSPTIYFAGDSGYFRGFKEIGRRFQIDVALMPIGAYEPEWFMGPQHVSPEEALQAFEDTGAKWFVPMHYGAFKLADDTPREALDRLEAERCRRCLEEDRVIVLPLGETWKLTKS